MSFTVATTDWARSAAPLSRLRQQVFVLEQGVPEALEWDGLDAAADHLLAVDRDGHAIGCARLLDSGHIGRMAVAAAWRGRGVGRTLLEHSLALAQRRGHRHLVLNAQSQVTGFYQGVGFVAVGEEFMEAGIPHRRMEIDLAGDP